MKSKNKEELTFSEIKKLRDEKREVNAQSIFCFILGTLITVFSANKALYLTGNQEKVFTVLAFIGAAIILIGAFCPVIAKKPLFLLRRFANFIGKYIIMVFLLPVYLIIFILSLFLKKKVGKDYEFFSWNEKEPDYSPHYKEPGTMEYTNRKNTFFSVVYNICSAFIEKKHAFLIPAAIILIIIGMIFFFISTSTVFSFVYTIF